MEEELDLSTPVERDITSESGAANGAEVSVGLDPSSQAASAAPEEASADHESTTAWDNPDVVSRQNLNSNNDALTSNAQQMWQESYGIKGGDEETSQPISEKAKAEKQAAEDDKRADFMERQERESEDRAERRRAEEERTLAKLEHMSLGDLQKMSTMFGNPAMQEKIEARLSKNGMSKDRIEKGKSEMKEYLDLRMKQEKEGKDKLTETEQQRLKDIKQSAEFKAFSVAQEQLSAHNGIKLSGKLSQEAQEWEHGSVDGTLRIAGKDSLIANQSKFARASSLDVLEEKNPSGLRETSYVSTTAREDFPSAANLSEAFLSASQGQVKQELQITSPTMASNAAFKKPELNASMTI